MAKNNHEVLSKSVEAMSHAFGGNTEPFSPTNTAGAAETIDDLTGLLPYNVPEGFGKKAVDNVTRWSTRTDRALEEMGLGPSTDDGEGGGTVLTPFQPTVDVTLPPTSIYVPKRPPKIVDPLVLDVDGDGIVQTLHLDKGIHFDLDFNGFAERTAWLGPEDGLVHIDRNHNGKVDDGSELFGPAATSSMSRNGFEALRPFDTNLDQRVDNQDALFSSLQIWIDKDSNGISAPSELFTFDELGIRSVGLAYDDLGTTDANSVQHSFSGVFSNARGTGLARSLDFPVDTIRSIPVAMHHGDGPPIDPAALALPEAKGYGNAYSLREKMSIEERPELIDQVRAFASETDALKRQRIVTRIIDLWMGSDGIAEVDRGPYVDHVHARIVEVLWGETQPGHYDARSAAHVSAVYSHFTRSVDSQLLAQTHLAHLFREINFAEGGKTPPDFTSLSRHLVAQAQSDRHKAQLEIAALIDCLTGLDGDAPSGKGLAIEFSNSMIAELGRHSELPSYERMALITNLVPLYRTVTGTPLDDNIYGLAGDDTILSGDGSDYVISGLGDDYVDGGSGDDIIYGGRGSDRLLGGNGDDVIFGGDGSDTIQGGPGDDMIHGGPGYNVLQGGEGQDILMSRGGGTLIGGEGSDAYFVSRQDESLRIVNDADQEGGRDILVFEDIAINEVLIVRRKEDLVIKIVPNGHAVTLADYFQPEKNELGSGSLYKILFSSGDSLSGAEVVAKFAAPTSGDDSLFISVENAAISGGDGDDSLVGDARDNILYGDGGNDILQGGSGNDYLYGGPGNDLLIGGAGSDTYVVSLNEGLDTIVGNASDQSTTADRIVFDGSIAPSQVRIARAYRDLVLDLPGDDNRVLIRGYFDNTFGIEKGYQIERIEFQDGTFWSTGDIQRATRRSTHGNDVLWGDASDDDLQGNGGDDTLRGLAGDDRLSGGSGDDRLLGGEGQDDLLGDAGSDSLYGEAGNDSLSGGVGNDRLEGGTGSDDLIGDAGDDTLLGDEGDDRLSGGKGNDLLIGGEGNDVYHFDVGDGEDTIIDSPLANGPRDGSSHRPLAVNRVEFGEGIGHDDISLSIGPGSLPMLEINYPGGAVRVVDGLRGVLTSIRFHEGSVVSLQSLLAGTPTELQLNDLGGEYFGSAANDLLQGGAGDDLLSGRDGDDLLNGGEGNDTLFGGKGSDVLKGGRGDDVLLGGAGDDTLEGGMGDDHVDGGGGANRYVISRHMGRDQWLADAGSTNTIVLGNGWSWEDFTYVRAGTNLLITSRYDVESQAELVGYYNDAGHWQVESGKGAMRPLNEVVMEVGSKPIPRNLHYQRAFQEQVIAANAIDALRKGYEFDSGQYVHKAHSTRHRLTTHASSTMEFSFSEAPLQRSVGTMWDSGQPNTVLTDYTTESRLTPSFREVSQQYLEVVNKHGEWTGVWVESGPSVTEQRVGTPVTLIRHDAWSKSTTTFKISKGSDTGGRYNVRGSNVFLGGRGDDKVVGYSSHAASAMPAGMYLSGGGGADTLSGSWGNDWLLGGGGSNYLYGWSGQDLYVIDASAGTDVITDLPAALEDYSTDPASFRDKVILPIDSTDSGLIGSVGKTIVEVSDLYSSVLPSSRYPRNGPRIATQRSTLDLEWGTGRVVKIVLAAVEDLPGAGIETIEFADGVQLSVAQIVDRLGISEVVSVITQSIDASYSDLTALSREDETLEFSGGTGDDTIVSLGSAVIHGHGGSDQLTGHYLYGGEGNDTLTALGGRMLSSHLDGGPGNDLYVLDANFTQTLIEVGGGSDTLLLGYGIELERMSFHELGQDLVMLRDGDKNDPIKVAGHFGGGEAALDRVILANGESLDLKAIEHRLTPYPEAVGGGLIGGSLGLIGTEIGQVDGLIEAMAGLEVSVGGQGPLPWMPGTQLVPPFLSLGELPTHDNASVN